MSSIGTPLRDRSLEMLCQGTFDVLVIGAGIVGSRIAYEAARAGLKVALIDSGDFGGATSSASAKLVHGGLRYLKTGEVSLVREAQRERHALLSRVAPHLVRRLPFVLAVGRQGPYRSAAIAAGLFAYAALGRFRDSTPRLISPGEVESIVPPLRAGELSACAVLQEAQTDDSRLTLATVKAATRAGAVAVNYLRVVNLERTGDRVARALLEGREGERTFHVRCRVVVNAAGPWLDHVRRLEDPACETMVRLSKGVHVVLPPVSGWQAAVALPLDETRHVYAVPWQGTLLLGTTDTAYEGDPGAVAPGRDDIQTLLDSAARLLPQELLRPEQVRFSFAGLRVLPPGDVGTPGASREHMISTGSGGMISVAGGKLTTHRRIALDVLRRFPLGFLHRRPKLSDDPLPGAARLAGVPAPLALLDGSTVEHLLRLYGSEVVRLLEYAAVTPDALERVHPEGPDIWAQVYYAVDREWALTVEDVVRRRTTLSVRGLASASVCTRIAALLSCPQPLDQKSALKKRSRL